MDIRPAQLAVAVSNGVDVALIVVACAARCVATGSPAKYGARRMGVVAMVSVRECLESVVAEHIRRGILRQVHGARVHDIEPSLLPAADEFALRKQQRSAGT